MQTQNTEAYVDMLRRRRRQVWALFYAVTGDESYFVEGGEISHMKQQSSRIHRIGREAR